MTFKVVLLIGILGYDCLAQELTLTQSIDNSTVVHFNSVSCNAGGLHLDNSYFRSYDLNLEGIATSIEVRAIRYGVETAIAGFGAGTQPAEIRIYVSATPPIDNLILLHSESFSIPDRLDSIETQTMATPIQVMPGAVLVVELFTPDGTALAHSFFVGSNDFGQTALNYLQAPACGITAPFDNVTIGYPDMHVILDILFVPSGQTFPGTAEDLILLSGVNGTLPTGGNVSTDVKSVTSADIITLLTVSPGGTFDHSSLVILGELFSTGSPPTPPFPGVAVSGNRGSVVVIYGGTPVPPFGTLPLLPPSGFNLSVIWPSSFAGLSVLVQSFIANGATINGIFASTNGQEFQGM